MDEHAFSLGGARPAEDVTVPAPEEAMRYLGFIRPKLDWSMRKLLTRVGSIEIPLLEDRGGKSLAGGAVPSSAF